MNWFKIFSKRKVDEDLLLLYLDIEILIKEIKKQFDNYFYLLTRTDFSKTHELNKQFYSIQKINVFIKRLYEEYGSIYTQRENKKTYDFYKSNNARAEKLEIEFQLKKIKEFLQNILTHVKMLDLSNFKKNDMTSLLKNIEQFLKGIEPDIDKVNNTFYLLNKIKEKDKHIVFEIINAILDESNTNRQKGIWLIDQESKEKKLFSQNLSIHHIKYLELVPILDMAKLEKRSLFINELHKDKTLPIYHYNLLINGENIHVVPKNYQERLKKYLFVA